jgi:hypothetical protein
MKVRHQVVPLLLDNLTLAAVQNRYAMNLIGGQP